MRLPGAPDFIWRYAGRMRRRSFALPGKPSMLSLAFTFLRSLGGGRARLEQKVDRLLDEIHFIKRRLASHLGDGISLTYLADETPIFVNSNDFGGPMNLIVGGLYEEENLEVLQSFVKADSIVLDIGANLGFFTLMLARRVRAPGHVHAFEPHPFVRDLMSRSVYLNGLTDRVTLYDCGLSDEERTADIHYPIGHLGGGQVASGQFEGFTPLQARLRRVDDILPAGTVVDVVKIDVEGHELAVLRGMSRTIAESPDIAILLEKLVIDAGYEAEIFDLLTASGLELYRVTPGAELERLTLAAFRGWGGYALAARPATIGSLLRAFFSIYPAQLTLNAPASAERPSAVVVSGQAGAVLFHGPYWRLARGFWKVELDGEIEGRATIVISERYGHGVVQMTLAPDSRDGRFFVDHDLINFECVARASAPDTRLTLRRLRFTRLSEKSLFRLLLEQGLQALTLPMRH